MIRFDRATIERAGQIVVECLSLDVPSGRAVAIIGPAGAGKSSLLAATATAIPLHAGDVAIDGNSVRQAGDAARSLLGYAPAALPAWPGMRAGEFLELFAAAAGLRGDRLHAAVAKAVALAGLPAEVQPRLDALSTGHAKRLLIARALLHDPQVLLLDDPFGGLDPAGRLAVERLIDDAHLMGRTVLAAIDDAAVPACFTHLAVLREGRLVAEGPNDQKAFAAGRRWTCRIVCPGRAEDAARAVADLGAAATVVDADTLACRHDPASAPLASVVAALVEAGIPVAAAGFHPPWTAQLLG
jgi:ABC-2 type transport system ATP-binding protein